MGRSKTVLLVLLGLAPLPALACFTVFDRADRIVYLSEKPPVDMSLPLHETVPARFPGGHLVFDINQRCPVTGSLAFGDGGVDVSTSSPMLTDERTARALKTPYRALGRGVVLVQQKDAKMAPGLSVLPTTRPAAQTPMQLQPMEAPPEAQPQPPLPPRRY
jgi:hypothetical protein